MRVSQMGEQTWLFPASTKSGHIEASTLRKQHAKAITRSKVSAFELYVLRHTCLTRWAEYMDPFALHVVAGHRDMKTTMRYVHPSDDHIRGVIEKVRQAQGGHTSGHTSNTVASDGATIPENIQ